MHERGEIHGALRPSAIAIAGDGAVTIIASGAIERSGSKACYESPEQIRGRTVDRRSDIWAFGCVLFETLSCAAAFSGESADTARAAALERHPDWSRLPADLPSRIVNLLKHCLQKDPRDRLHDIADARIEIDATLRTDTDMLERARRPQAVRPTIGWIAALFLLVLSVWLGWSARQPAESDTGPGAGAGPIRAAIDVGAGTNFVVGRGSSIAVSPDGRAIVFVAESQGKTQLYRRSIDQESAHPIAGTDGAADPFFSPDGRWIGFVTGEHLMKAPINGGAAVVIADAPTQRGLAWSEDDAIFVTPRDNTGLWRVPSSGGTLEQITSLAEGDASHRWPHLLPGGRAVMYTIWGGSWETARVAIQPLAGGRVDPQQPRKVIVTGAGFARFVPGPSDEQGHIVYATPEGIWAAPFNTVTQEVTSEAASLGGSVITNFSGAAQFDVSRTGLLAHVSLDESADRSLIWVSRNGSVTPAITLRGLGRWFALSPDASRLVRYKVDEHTRDVWVENLAQHKSTRVSFTADVTASATGDRLNAVWSNDGRWIAYAAGTPLNVYVSSLDGTVKDRRLTTSDRIQWPSSWAPGDRALAVVEVDPLTGQDIKIVTLDANWTAQGIRPFLSTPFSESAPMISPGGEWLAYQSNESGRYEVYVQPYPDGGQRLQVSADNGVYPRWSRKGNELFFRSGANRAGVASATITGRGRPQAPPARVLFERRGVESVFDVSADDQRFLLMPTLASSAAPKIDILANWFTSRGR